MKSIGLTVITDNIMALQSIADSSSEVAALIERLEENTKLKKNGRCLKFENTLENSNERIISWKFNEWDYGKENKISLPSNARGLFTVGNKIAVRGYDKFFNIGETQRTSIVNLQSNSSGPYEVTVKENGCIIFISGLANGDLIVCSKHSTGKRNDLSRNHAVQGEIELEKQLAKINKTKSSLAKELHFFNITAVAELCDDSFEEHVLPYEGKNAGLYLHGLNQNTIGFRTYPMSTVSSFAEKWGFVKVHSFLMNDFNDLYGFLTECSKTGTYSNREVEGFVVRCKYNGHDFFFKYKFEEPYLLYRQLREATKQLVIERALISQIVSRLKKHKFITLKYLEFVENEFKENEALKHDFLNGRGIIKLRELFLADNNLDANSGMKLLEYEGLDSRIKELSLSVEPRVYKYVLVPILTIGCGKTTVFQTLTELFPKWKHVQNDNLSSKVAKTRLVASCLEALSDSECPLVFCDRNNHQYRERAQLFQQFRSMRDNYLSSDVGLKFIAVNFFPESVSLDTLREITMKRVKCRGDNHQSIKFNTQEQVALKVMQGFIDRFQPFDSDREPDCNFDAVIDLQISENSSLLNVNLLLHYLHENPNLVPNLPTEKEIEIAFIKALLYVPLFTKTFGKTDKKQKQNSTSNKKESNSTRFGANENNASSPKKKAVYYGISVDRGQIYRSLEESASKNEVWQKLLSEKRIQKAFHITLAHMNSRKVSVELASIWDNLTSTFMAKKSNSSLEANVCFVNIYCDVSLKNVVFVTEQLACIEVKILNFRDAEKNALSIPCANQYPHITIGTLGNAKPFQSNLILQALHGDHGDTLPEGDYRIDGKEVKNIEFKEDIILRNLICFIHY